jgi:hypothetical protein
VKDLLDLHSVPNTHMLPPRDLHAWLSNISATLEMIERLYKHAHGQCHMPDRNASERLLSGAGTSSVSSSLSDHIITANATALSPLGRTAPDTDVHSYQASAGYQQVNIVRSCSLSGDRPGMQGIPSAVDRQRILKGKISCHKGIVLLAFGWFSED